MFRNLPAYLVAGLCFVLVGLLAGTSVFADRSLIRAGETYTLEESATVDGDLYLAAETLYVRGTTTGDVLTFGLMETRLEGPVGADVLAVGSKVLLDAPVAGDARLVGGEIFVRSSTSEDMIIAAGSVVIDAATHIGGDLIIYAELVQVDGVVDGSVTIYARTIQLKGAIGGNADIRAQESLALIDTARVGGDLTYRAPREALISGTASVEGNTEYTHGVQEQTRAIYGTLMQVFVLVFGALTLLFLLPAFTRETVDRVLADTGFIALKGFLIFIAGPIVVSMLVVTMFGVLPGLVLLSVWGGVSLVSFMMTPILASAILARWLKKDSGLHWSWVVVGVVALLFLTELPVIGWVLRFVLFLMVFGTICVYLYERIWPPVRQPTDAPQHTDDVSTAHNDAAEHSTEGSPTDTDKRDTQ